MMAPKPNNLGKITSPHCKEEQEILQQLSQLDLKLKGKTTGKQSHNHQNLWGMPEGKGETQLKNWGKGKSEAALPTYNHHMEYFSQICNQDVDQDSLFDTHNNFLGQAKHTGSNLKSYTNSNSALCAKKKDELDQHECSFGQKHSQQGYDLPNYSQILKQRNYVYKKQSERPSNYYKQLPTQKNNKNNHEKSASILQKTKEKLMSQPSFRQNSENTKLKVKSKQKYQIKANLIQQQIKIQQQQLNRFSTFQSFLSKAVQLNNPDKQGKKAKCLKEESNQDSLECTFKPSILKKSCQMAKSTKNVVERLSPLNQSKQKKPYNPQPPKPQPNKQRIELLSQPRKLKTLGPQYVEQTPSFRPSLSKKSLQQMSNCMYDVATRNQLWLEQKKEKLQKMKQEQQLQRSKRQSCTYSPAICQYKGQNDPRFSRFGKQGIANYFERLSGVNKNITKPKGEQSFQNKQNKSFVINQTKGNYISKGGKKPNYQQAVKQLHSRIMKLKI